MTTTTNTIPAKTPEAALRAFRGIEGLDHVEVVNVVRRGDEPYNSFGLWLWAVEFVVPEDWR